VGAQRKAGAGDDAGAEQEEGRLWRGQPSRVARASQKVLMILDQYGIHTAKVVQPFTADTQGRLELVWLLSYCPKDTPREEVWSSLQQAHFMRASLADSRASEGYEMRSRTISSAESRIRKGMASHG
jgi:hypothetical protein